MKFRINPLFFALVLALILLGQALPFAWTLLALFLHEAAHVCMARLRGFQVKRIELLPYGAMMSLGESFDGASAILIGLAGPAINGLTALVTLGVWWLFPAIYPITIPFFYANVALCLFNLLPAYPLDGARVTLGLAKNKLRAIKGLQTAGVALSVAAFAMFVASCFFEINLSLGVIAVFLFYGAAFGTRDEMYISVFDSASKNLSLGVEKKRVAISASAPIARLYHHVSSLCDVTFEIMGDKGETIASLDEAALKKIAVANRLSASIGDALAGRVKEGKKRPAAIAKTGKRTIFCKSAKNK